MGGNYIEFTIDRDAIARYGLRVGDVQDVLQWRWAECPLPPPSRAWNVTPSIFATAAIFGKNLGALREIIVPTPAGAQVPLGQLAKIETVHAPMASKARAPCPTPGFTWTSKALTLAHTCNGHARRQRRGCQGQINLPSGYKHFWSGQYEYMQRAKQRLLLVVRSRCSSSCSSFI